MPDADLQKKPPKEAGVELLKRLLGRSRYAELPNKASIRMPTRMDGSETRDVGRTKRPIFSVEQPVIMNFSAAY